MVEFDGPLHTSAAGSGGGTYLSPHQKAEKLLRRWLTPNQLKQWKDSGRFNVVGSSGGEYIVGDTFPRVYRRKKRWFGRGYKAIRYCVAPENPFLPSSDEMLALKVMLEIDERYVLKKANRMNGGVAYLDPPI